MINVMYSKVNFDNPMCLECKILPLCWGPCIQKKYESVLKKELPNCLLEGAEYSVDSYIIEKAKKYDLV